eukprot:TRINITY_DN360_c0_g2_i2.p43 TRINITY_DN360_c0_g2~~TRINITY_DN360_c0_g2_i2.p43  ORF type:complete len:126 (-),score=3.53 TRINITY_DN360_c0_g2_i2:627-1004(-)
MMVKYIILKKNKSGLTFTTIRAMSNRNKGILNKIGDRVDSIVNKPALHYIRDMDRVWAKALNIEGFDENAWYYDKKKVAEWKLKNIPYRRDLFLFEQDFHAIFIAYLKLLCNYEVFIVAAFYIYM